jgi:hypothetical protein
MAANVFSIRISFETFVSFVANSVFVAFVVRSALLDEPVLERLGDVLSFDASRRREISDCPRDFQQSVVAARAEGEPLGGGEQQRSSFRVGAAMRSDGATSEIRVHARPIRAKARPLKKTRRENALAH